jgi:hypothetical protein
MSHCPFCKKKIAMSKAFCSRKCKDDYFQFIAIQIRPSWLKNINRIDCSQEKEDMITEFAIRHKFRLDLLKSKIDEELEKLNNAEESYL